MVERLFKLREGLKKDDPLKGEMLVDRYFYEPCRLGALDVVGAKLDREKTQRNEGRVLQYARCDEDGIPTPQALKRLGLEKFDTDILP